MRREHHPAAPHGRFTDGAVAGAARALLAVRLGAAARNRLAGFRRCGSLAGVGHLAHVGLVHHRRVRLLGKDELGQLHMALALAGGIKQRRLERILILLLLYSLSGGGLRRGRFSAGGRGFGRRFGLRSGRSLGRGLPCRHQTFLPVGLPAGPFTFIGLVDWRTSTSAPLAPGTPPLTRIKLRSASTLTTL